MALVSKEVLQEALRNGIFDRHLESISNFGSGSFVANLTSYGFVLDEVRLSDCMKTKYESRLDDFKYMSDELRNSNQLEF